MNTPAHACVHARIGQAMVDIATEDKRITPHDIEGAVPFIDNLLGRLRMGRSRRNQYHDVRQRLRRLRALCKAAERFWSSS